MRDNKTAYSITFSATWPQMLTIFQDQTLTVGTYKNGWKSVKIWQKTIGARQIKSLSKNAAKNNLC